MRQFTKEHNDLNWLFPVRDHTKINIDDTPETVFDDFEKTGKFYLSECYNDQQTFTRDDMIDAFMKGTSTAYRELVFEFDTQIRSYEYYKEHREHLDYVQKLIDTIKLLQDEKTKRYIE